MSIRDSRTLVRSGAALLAAAALLLPAAGCTGRDAQQAQVTKGAKVSEGLTPLQRGELRREALVAAQKAVDSWKTNDTKAMAPYWDKSYIEYYDKVNAEFAAKGIRKVRKLDNITTFDVTEMDETGTEVLVNILFDDGGYYTDTKGVATSKPSNKPTQMQLTMRKQSGSWKVTRMIAGMSVMR